MGFPGCLALLLLFAIVLVLLCALALHGSPAEDGDDFIIPFVILIIPFVFFSFAFLIGGAICTAPLRIHSDLHGGLGCTWSEGVEICQGDRGRLTCGGIVLEKSEVTDGSETRYVLTIEGRDGEFDLPVTEGEYASAAVGERFTLTEGE